MPPSYLNSFWKESKHLRSLSGFWNLWIWEGSSVEEHFYSMYKAQYLISHSGKTNKETMYHPQRRMLPLYLHSQHGICIYYGENQTWLYLKNWTRLCHRTVNQTITLMLTDTFTPNLLEVSHLMSFSHIWHVLSPDSTSVRPSHFPTVLVKPLTASFFKSYASGVLFSP